MKKEIDDKGDFEKLPSRKNESRKFFSEMDLRKYSVKITAVTELTTIPDRASIFPPFYSNNC